MIEDAFRKLEQLHNLLHSREQMNDMKPEGPLKAKRVKYPVVTKPELDCPEPTSMKTIQDPMRDLYKTARKNHE